jgi:hypothetical protein
MKSLPILIIALMIAVIVPHVCAENVTYPQGYYDAITHADSITDAWHNNGDNWQAYKDTFNALNYRLIAVQIALEKQNELINEQNELLKKLLNQTYIGKPMEYDGKLVYGGGYYFYIQPNP